jgi:general secretion pathway protein G
MICRLTNDQRVAVVQPGFTLIEIIIAIGIALGFLALVVPKIYKNIFRGERDTTKIILTSVKQEIERYKMDTRKYPESLRDLLKKPADEKKWEGPYVDREEDLEDSWGEKLQYKRTVGGKHAYELYSWGSSEGAQTPEDQRINVWDI